MQKLLGSAAAALILAGCGGGDNESNTTVAGPAAALQPGEYELVAKVDNLRSTDKTTPATRLKVGEAVTSKSCIGPDNAVAATAFAEAGESCTASETYIRNGRLNLQLRCKQPGKGDVTHAVDGQFKADSFEATVTSGSSFSGTGDYAMTRSITGRRVGECSASAV